jgi:hypothetical protein
MITSSKNRATIGKAMTLCLLLATLLATALAAIVLALSALAGPAESATTAQVVTRTAGTNDGANEAAIHAKALGGFERKQRLNVVQCPTGGSSFLCLGTGGGDALIGRDGTYDWIQGGEGDDAYDGKGGCDALQDTSLTSSDRYLVSVEDFCNIGISWLSIQDDGGNKDVLDLGGFYRSSNFVFSKGYINLYLDGPGVNDISVDNFFTTGSDMGDSIETFKFSDKTLTARQVRDMVM